MSELTSQEAHSDAQPDTQPGTQTGHGWHIAQVDYDSPEAQSLIEAVQAEYEKRYGGRDETPLTADAFSAPHGAFFIGYLDGVPVATGAWRMHPDFQAQGFLTGADPIAEVKRMYVVPDYQRRGLARKILAHLEQSAQAAGAQAVVLETGTEQPEALALYLSSGYREIPKYGYYCHYESARCFGKLASES